MSKETEYALRWAAMVEGQFAPPLDPASSRVCDDCQHFVRLDSRAGRMGKGRCRLVAELHKVRGRAFHGPTAKACRRFT